MSILNVNTIQPVGSGQTITVTATNISAPNTFFAVAAGSTSAPSISPSGDSNTGIFFPSADTVAIGEGGAEAARIDSSGRLLVGTSSASASASAVFQGYGGAPAGPALLHLCTGTATPTAELGYIIFGNSSQNEGATITAWRDGGTWTSGSSHPSRLVFSTTADGASSPTERMRITNSGNCLINKTNDDGQKLQVVHSANTIATVATFVNSAATATNQYGLVVSLNSDPNDGTRYFLRCEGSTTERATIRSNGGLANFSANNVNLSDINAKKDISPAAGTWDCIKKWEIVNYRYKDQPDDSDLNLGVIAQHVAESCPEVITVFQEAKEATEDQPAQEEKLGVKEQQMYWMAIKALQEAQVRIEQLEAKVAALESA